MERLPEPARPAQVAPAVRRAQAAKAAVAPSNLVVAGAGALAVVLTPIAGLPFLAVAGVAAAVWGGRVALAASRPPRDSRRPRPRNPYSLPPPWRDYVADAVRYRERFGQAAMSGMAGPLRQHLLAMGERLDAGIDECWVIAERGAVLNEAITHLGEGEIVRRLSIVQTQLRYADPSGPTTPDLHRTVTSMRAQLATVERIRATADDARYRLQLFVAQLGEAVAEAVELTVRQRGIEPLAALSNSVETIVGELQSLRRAMEDTDPAGSATP
jgi:hypothetical protein